MLILANFATAESGLVRTGTEPSGPCFSASRTREAARAMEYWARQITEQSTGFSKTIKLENTIETS